MVRFRLHGNSRASNEKGFMITFLFSFGRFYLVIGSSGSSHWVA